MLETQFSLSWEQHMYNISYGLSQFQQNGEFVDITLAADGSFVKAHQMILSLVSPYIKDIIDSLNCTHPVIFLNNISYETLCSILDYVYKGEVQVTDEQLKDLINAGKLLHIKGLQEMSSQTSTISSSHQAIPINSIKRSEEKNNMPQLETAVESEEQIDIIIKDQAIYDNDQDFVIEDDQNQAELEIKDDHVDPSATTHNDSNNAHNSFIINQDVNDFPSPFFTVSNQGSLQLVFNRYLYFLKYKSTRASGHAQWKCVNYINTKCPAFIITKNDKVIQKYVRHIHWYHDHKIAKKVETGSMFSSMKKAEEYGRTKKFSNYRRKREKMSYTS